MRWPCHSRFVTQACHAREYLEQQHSHNPRTVRVLLEMGNIEEIGLELEKAGKGKARQAVTKGECFHQSGPRGCPVRRVFSGSFHASAHGSGGLAVRPTGVQRAGLHSGLGARRTV